MAKAVKSLNGWVRIPGRKFQNVETGEILSRRQYDKISGRVEGSYEAKAAKNKVSNPALAAARPARGRSSKVAKTEHLTKSGLEQALKDYRITGALKKSTYTKYKSLHEGFNSINIKIKHPMLEGVALDGQQEKAEEEVFRVLGIVEAVVKQFDRMSDVVSYSVNVVTAAGLARHSAVNWNHGLILAGDMPNMDKLFSLLVDGESNNSSAGPVVNIIIRPYFSIEYSKKLHIKTEPVRAKMRAKSKGKK